MSDIVIAQVITAISMLCLFYSGAPNAAFYSGIIWIVFVVALIHIGLGRIRQFLWRLTPQIMCFCFLVVPLLYAAYQTIEFYQRYVSSANWLFFSVPLQAYTQLFLPISYAWWTTFYGETGIWSGLLLSVGVVPCWFIVLQIIAHPSCLFRRQIYVLIIGLAVLVTLLSPQILPWSSTLPQLPILEWFRWPFRGIPAFHILLIVLFLSLSAMNTIQRRMRVNIALVVMCLGFSLFALGHDYLLARGKQTSVSSWLAVCPDFSDSQGRWTKSTLDLLMDSGYVMSLCKSWSTYFTYPEPFFHGNLGAFYKVPTVGSYLYGHVSNSAFRELGMTYRGFVTNWDKAKQFIELSPKKPPKNIVRWDNNIGPASMVEYARKTYVKAVVVETPWREPMEYFSNSPSWQLVQKHDKCALYIRMNDR
jgi:hypothetical protein